MASAGNLILPDGLEGPAVGGVDEQDDDGDAEDGHQEGEEGGQPQDDLAVGPCDVEAGEGGEALEHGWPRW